MEVITTGMSQAVTYMTTCWTTMLENPYLCVFLGATMFSVGVRIFTLLRSGT